MTEYRLSEMEDRFKKLFPIWQQILEVWRRKEQIFFRDPWASKTESNVSVIIVPERNEYRNKKIFKSNYYKFPILLKGISIQYNKLSKTPEL